VTVTILPFGIDVECSARETLLESILNAGIQIASVCGGNGTCGRCIIELIKGQVAASTADPHAEIIRPKGGSNLFYACTVYPRTDCTVFIPESSLENALAAQTEYQSGIEERLSKLPVITTFQLSLFPPDLSDNRSDVNRIIDATAAESKRKIKKIDTTVLTVLSSILRKNNWCITTAVYDDELIFAGPADEKLLILAADIGTTKCAIYLLDAKNGKKIDAAGILNPQSSYGADVVSRLGKVINDGKLRGVLQKRLIEEISRQTELLCDRNGLKPENIVHSVFVGNTAMHHLFFGLEVESLVNSPYVPVISQEHKIKIREVGFPFSRGGYAYWLPNIAGYVGSDHLAVLLSSDALDKSGNVLFMDIGTNTEMSLSTPEGIYTVSAPSGPAFEGAHIRYGMRAVPGAIDTFWVDRQGLFHYTTIGKGPPKGICGSGMLDIITEAFTTGIIDWRGRLRDHPGVTVTENEKRLMIAGEIYLSQNDIREFQLVKGAIASGIYVLAETAEIQLTDITEVFVAGAFGSFINVENAVRIGMFPFAGTVPIVKCGNAAGAGACIAAGDETAYEKVRQICEKVRYIELVNAPGFKKTYARAAFMGNEKITTMNTGKADG
jgi:uncharacterized 2Fe-2S/4Fe-4S cluster protein (DUF4445 family)